MIIEIDKKYLIGIVFAMLIITGTFFVVSYGGNDPSYAGHFNEEVNLSGLKDFCIFSAINSVCPSGWSPKDFDKGRTIKIIDPNGQKLLGGIGGEDTKQAAGDTRRGYADPNSYSKWATNWPPYINVRLCCKD